MSILRELHNYKILFKNMKYKLNNIKNLIINTLNKLTNYNK